MQSINLQYRLAKKSELPACKRILKAAFSNYPLFQVFVDDARARERFNSAILDVWLSGIKKNTVLLMEDEEQILAVAVLQSPTDYGYSDLDYISIAGFRALLAGGYCALKGFRTMTSQTGEACRKLPHPKWHLCLMGVAPEGKGKGYGSRMLQDGIIPYVAAHGGGVLTFNTNAEINRTFYIKNGFVEFSAITFPAGKKMIGDWCYRMDINTPEISEISL